MAPKLFWIIRPSRLLLALVQKINIPIQAEICIQHNGLHYNLWDLSAWDLVADAHKFTDKRIFGCGVYTLTYPPPKVF